MRRGFTLLEVMVGLALLGFGLIVLIKSAAGSIFSAQQANMLGIATDLSRAKMYDIEEILIKDGFSDTDQSKEGETFNDQGWPDITYSYKVIPVELPSLEQLQALAEGKAIAAGSGSGSGSNGKAVVPGLGSGSGSGSDYTSTFQDSALGGMVGMLGGGGFGGNMRDASSSAGSSLIQGKFQMFQEAMKVSIRKVVLTVNWKVLGRDRELVTVAFFTDQAALDKVMGGALNLLSALNSAGSSGSGSGSAIVTTPGKVTK